jgi:divalent metal cation (Fe/Co/Zn/Cd) transporter
MPDDPSAGDDSIRRGVPVPMAIYKVVTVFSMLIAILLVVGGFSVVDTATDRGTAAPGEVDVVVALAGVALVLLGGVVYVFSTRFRAEEMENAKDDAD